MSNTTAITMMVIFNVLFALNGTIHPKSKVGKLMGFVVLFTALPATFTCIWVFVTVIGVNDNFWLALAVCSSAVAVLIAVMVLADRVAIAFDKRA